MSVFFSSHSELDRCLSTYKNTKFAGKDFRVEIARPDFKERFARDDDNDSDDDDVADAGTAAVDDPDVDVGAALLVDPVFRQRQRLYWDSYVYRWRIVDAVSTCILARLQLLYSFELVRMNCCYCGLNAARCCLI